MKKSRHITAPSSPLNHKLKLARNARHAEYRSRGQTTVSLLISAPVRFMLSWHLMAKERCLMSVTFIGSIRPRLATGSFEFKDEQTRSLKSNVTWYSRLVEFVTLVVTELYVLKGKRESGMLWVMFLLFHSFLFTKLAAQLHCWQEYLLFSANTSHKFFRANSN